MNEIFDEVEILIRNEVPHRSGFKLTDERVTHQFVAEQMADEVDELIEQLKLDAKLIAAKGGRPDARPPVEAMNELADVFGTVVHLAKRFGMTPDNLEQYALAKIRQRFLYPQNPDRTAPIFVVAYSRTAFDYWVRQNYPEALRHWKITRFSVGQFHYVVNADVFRGTTPASIYRLSGWEGRSDFPKLVEAIHEQKLIWETLRMATNRIARETDCGEGAGKDDRPESASAKVRTIKAPCPTITFVIRFRTGEETEVLRLIARLASKPNRHPEYTWHTAAVLSQQVRKHE
jgi:hypothetical protein